MKPTFETQQLIVRVLSVPKITVIRLLLFKFLLKMCSHIFETVYNAKMRYSKNRECSSNESWNRLTASNSSLSTKGTDHQYSAIYDEFEWITESTVITQIISHWTLVSLPTSPIFCSYPTLGNWQTLKITNRIFIFVFTLVVNFLAYMLFAYFILFCYNLFIYFYFLNSFVSHYETAKINVTIQKALNVTSQALVLCVVPLLGDNTSFSRWSAF